LIVVEEDVVISPGGYNYFGTMQCNYMEGYIITNMGTFGGYWRAITGEDSDNDYVPDFFDNCPDIPNLDQGDIDEDGIGNACELTFNVLGTWTFQNTRYDGEWNDPYVLEFRKDGICTIGASLYSCFIVGDHVQIIIGSGAVNRYYGNV